MSVGINGEFDRIRVVCPGIELAFMMHAQIYLIICATGTAPWSIKTLKKKSINNNEQMRKVLYKIIHKGKKT